MQPRKKFNELVAQIEARKQRLLAAGVISYADFEACQNSGLRRTPEKRELLRRIRERCIATGLTPVDANF